MTTATEPVTEAAPVQTEAAPIEQEQVTETPAPAKQFNPEALPAEIKSYVEKQREEVSKKYSDYEQKKAAAQEWESVRNDPRFQQWAQSLNKPAAEKPFEITDDQFAAALSDKQQFVALVNQAAQQLLKEQVGPQLESVQRRNEFQEKVSEIQQTVAKYPDFKDLDKRGLIEPIIRRYPNMTFEDAYKIAKHSTINEEADRRARGIIAGKKAATVERPGSPSGGKSPRVSAKNREEAMTMVAEAIRAGRPVPEFDEIGD